MSDAEKPAAGGGNKKLILIVLVAVLVSVGAAVGGTMLLLGGKDKEVAAEHGDEDEGGDAEEGDEERAEGGRDEGGGNPTYVSLEPAFVVNFQDTKRRTKFLKAEISVFAKTPKAQEALTLHMPAVRNSLVMLLSRQLYEELSTNEGKEKLRLEALDAVKAVIKEQTSKKTAKAVKDLYFSSLVMQ